MSDVFEAEIGRVFLKIIQDSLRCYGWPVRHAAAQWQRSPDWLEPVQERQTERRAVLPENTELSGLMGNRTIRDMLEKCHLLLRHRKKPTLNVAVSVFGLCVEPVVEVLNRRTEQ